MKEIAYLLFSFVSLISFSQENSINILDKLLVDLSIDKNSCRVDLITTKSISESEIIFVIPEIEEKGEEYQFLNGYILIVDKGSGIIKSRFYEKKLWVSDALRLTNIEVVYQPYQISKNSETIGVLINYAASSRVDPYYSKELSLFVRNNEEIECVLKNYRVCFVNGETNGMGDGTFIEHNRTIEHHNNGKSDYYNLRVTDSITKSQVIDGIEKVIDKSIDIESLKYQKGTYKIKMK